MKNLFLFILLLILFSCVQSNEFEQYNDKTEKIKQLEEFDKLTFAKKVQDINFEFFKNPIVKKSKNTLFSLVSEKKEAVYNLKRTISKISEGFKIRYILKNTSPKTYIVRWIVLSKYEKNLIQGEKAKEFRLQSNQTQRWDIIVKTNPYRFKQKIKTK